MFEENVNDVTPVRRLTSQDIGSPLGARESVNPETGLTGDSKSSRRLTAKELSEGFGGENGGASPVVSYTPGGIGKIEKTIGEGEYHPELGDMYNRTLLHERQTATSMIANSIGRFAIEVGATALQTIAYDSDLSMGADLAENTQKEFGNELSRFAESMQEWGQAKMPIYVDPYKVGKFDPGSLSWWAENAISVGSSIGMVAPAMLLSAATGGVAAGIGLGSLAGTNAFRGITTALWSRHAENLMEASGVYKQAFNEAKMKGMSDEDATHVASLGAANTYNKQWALLAQDIPQYILLNKLGAFAKGGAAAEKAAIQELSPGIQKYLGYGTLNTTAKRVGAVAKDMASEGGEELYQFLINEQSNLMARNAADPNHNVKHSMMDALKANYDNGEMWTAGFAGALGAGAMQASLKGMNYKVQEAVNKAQFETVTSIGPTLKQSYAEYDAALADNDPIKAEEAAPAFIVAFAMKLKKTGTTAAAKDMFKQMRNAPKGTGFEQYGVDAETQGRLKEDPAFYEQLEKGIDRVGELYDRYLKENQSNNKISKEDKEPKAQAMANTKFLLDSTIEHVKKLTSAVETSWSQVEEVENLSPAGNQAEMLKQQKISKERSIADFKKRQDSTVDTATPEEKKQIEASVAKLNSEIALIDNLIDEQIGNKEKGIKGIRTAKEKKADDKIVLPQDQVDEYVKQSKRLNASNASIAQLTEVMNELRSSTPLSETREKQIKNELGIKPDKIDKDNSVQLDDKVEYEDPETKEAIKGKIVGVEEADEADPNAVTSFVIETETGETVVKAEGTFDKVGDETSDSEDDQFDSLSEEDELLLNRPSQVEDEQPEKIAMINMNKLSYSRYDPISKTYISRNTAFSEAINNKNISFAGSQAFYKLDVNAPETKLMFLGETDKQGKRITTGLLTEGVYTKEGFKVVVTDKQRAILTKFFKGTKLTKTEISDLLDESNDDSFRSFVDGMFINIEVSLNSTSYYGGLYLHGSRFVPDSSIPIKEKTNGKTFEARQKNIELYKKQQYIENRKIRRDMLSILLQGGKISTVALDRSRGTGNSASKSIDPSTRNKNLETAFGIPAEKIKIAITKSNDLTPELTTLYLNKTTPVKGTAKKMQGKGGAYAYLAGEGLNNEAGIVKLNKGTIDRELASIILDAFFLVAQAKVHRTFKDKNGKKQVYHSHAVKFTEEVLKRHSAKITGITAGELIDLFVTNGEKVTSPEHPRFQKRYGHDPKFANLMKNKRLYMYIKGKDVFIMYGNDPTKGDMPYFINLNQTGVPAEATDLTRMREHFVDWMVKNKRITTHLREPYGSLANLNLDGDFLDDRTVNIEYSEKDASGKKVKRVYKRSKGQTYSSFIIKNNMVVTDVSRTAPKEEGGSLFVDPVINLNLINGKGLNISSNLKPLPVRTPTEAPKGTITNEDLKNKHDAAFSDTKEEKEEQKPAAKKKATAYKNRFTNKADRSSYDANTLDPNEDQWTKETLIPNISNALEEMIEQGLGIDEIKKKVEDSLLRSNITFGAGSKRNVAILAYLDDRFAGKTGRTLSEEFNAATTPGADKTSATSTEATGAPIETTINDTEVEENKVLEYLESKRNKFGTITVYRGVKEGGEKGTGQFWTTDERVARWYAGEGGHIKRRDLSWDEAVKHFMSQEGREGPAKGSDIFSLPIETEVRSEREWMTEAVAILAKYEDKSYASWGLIDAWPNMATVLDALEKSKKIPKLIRERIATEGSNINRGQNKEAKAPPSMASLKRKANNEESGEPVYPPLNLKVEDRWHEEEPPFARKEVTTPYESYTKEIRQKEIKWAFDAIGIAEEEWKLKDRIVDLMYKGERNFALYSHSAILLYEAAELGTVYHEAFHRVSLGYLTPGERKQFYRAARLAYGIDKESTDRQVEEILAEKLRSFLLSDNKQQVPGSIQKFFDWIIKGIKALFYGERRLAEDEINTLFKQIRNGKYRNSSILEVNKESLGDELYARAIIKGVKFDSLNSRKDFRTITNSLAMTLLIQSKVEDRNSASDIDFMTLIKHLEELRDGYKANAEYAGNSKEDRLEASHLYQMYDEILGEKVYEVSETEKGVSEEERAIVGAIMGNIDRPYRYNTFQQVIKPAIDSFFLSIGIKQTGVDETDYLGVDTESPEEISRIGDHYVGAAYELNKRDTALPAIKYLIATLNANSEFVEDKETGALRRVPKVNPITMLYEPIDFKQVWSKLFHAVHHLNSIEDMIDELRYIASHDNYTPFAELADKLDKETTNTRIQFFTTLSCNEYDFVNIGFTESNSVYRLTLNRSSEQSAINDNIRNWSNVFFNSDNIIQEAPLYNAKLNTDGTVKLNKKGETIADLKGPITYVRIFQKSFFDTEIEKYKGLAQDLADVVNSNIRNYEGRLVKFLPRVVDFLSDFGIIVDEDTIRRVISDIQGDEIDNDIDRLYNWVENSLITLVQSAASEAATNSERAERSKHGFFPIGVVKDIARAYIEVHPELKSDIQVGPGDGDTKRQHKRNTFAENSHATDVVNRIKNTEGYVEERVTNMWTKRSKILHSMIPADRTNEEQVKIAMDNRANFGLVTHSYIRETATEDKGRGYLNMTEREDYIVRFHNVLTEGLLPFPIMAQRKTYFYMDGVERFRNTVTDYNPKTRDMKFSDEVIDYFWDAYKDENERVYAANNLIDRFNKAKGEEKEDLRKQLIVNYHFVGSYNTSKANAVKLIRFTGFDITDRFDITTKAKFTKKVTAVLNKRIKEELVYANNLSVISFDTDTNGYIPGIVNPSSIGTYSSERDEDVDFGVRATVGEYTINYVMSIIESERIFMGDPALFARNKNSGEIVEDLYKRYYGLGSTGQPYAEMIHEDSEETSVTYTAATIRTQKFKSLYYGALVDLHTRLWEKHFNEKDPDNPKNNEKAKALAAKNLNGYLDVDSTDGGAIISYSMFKSMIKRSGGWTKKVQYAFELLMSDKILSAEEEINALHIVLNPQKTVYFGMHSENGIDRTVYDKMSMSVLFPRLVKGTHLERVLDRMEMTGEYPLESQLRSIEGKRPLQKIQVFNYDSSVKIGQTVSHDLFVDKQTRDKLSDLTDIVTENRYWKNLRRQQVTDAHAVADKQMVGTQVFKIASSNIRIDQEYGEFKTGRDLLNSLTKSRMAVSNNGRHHVEATLGIRNGIVSNRSLIEMLRRDAIKAKKSEDFRSALKLDSDGRMYLELDSFPDRTWVYSRLMNLVTSNTIDLKLPGSQLIQVSDYGYSSKGIEDEKSPKYKSELKFYEEDKGGTHLVSIECRIPIRAFKRLIPNYDNLKHDERVALLPKNMKIMGYRIPTQGQNSVVNMTVVEYLPDQAGEVIHLPLEFTTLSGSDFDIDKLFTIMKNYRVENGVLKEIVFNNDSTEKGVTDRYDSKLRELYKIYRNDYTVFDDDTRKNLKKIGQDTKGEVNASFGQDATIRRNIVESQDANIRALERATDEISRQYLEDIILSEQARIDEIDDKDFSDQLNSEKWAKQKSIVLKSLLSANKIDSISEFGNLPVEEQNTSEANENRMFDIFQTVISDLKHARNTTLPLGTLTDELKERRDTYVGARSGGKIVPLEAFQSETPSYQSATKFKFMTSTKGIGVYALQNANHSLTQQANVRLRTKFKYGVEKNGSIPLDLIEGSDLKYVTDWLSAMLDAHVDAIKDNYIAELNVNSATYSVTSLLLRLGFGINTFDFMAQPIIVELAKEFYNLGGGKHAISEDAEYEDGTTIQKAYAHVKRKLLASLNRDVDEAIDLKKEDIFIPFTVLMGIEGPLKDKKNRPAGEKITEEEKKKANELLIEGINTSKNTTQEHKLRQLNFLEHFMKISTDAEKVNSLVLNTRVDTKSFGSNPIEFKYFMNKLIALEQEELPIDKRDFINLSRFINSNGDYVENGTMLSPLLKNSIYYLEKIFNDKSIVGSTGFNRIFWNIASSIPDNEKFRMSTINSITGDLFGAIVAPFFSDPRFGVSMNKDKLTALFNSNKNSIFTTLMKVKSPKFKYYEELKDNKALHMLQIDSKPLTSVESHITTPFQAASDTWDNDDYIADFKALIEHEDDTVRKLGRQIFLYSFYSTGYKHRRYDYIKYLPVSIMKSINMIQDSKTKKEKPASFNDYVRYMLDELNDPASVVEFYNNVKKDFFENNWYNYKYVSRIGDNIKSTISRNEKDGFIDYVIMQFSRASKYALGTNEDGNVVYPSYITMDGGADLAQYQIPRTPEEIAETSEMEEALQPTNEESEIIGGNTALFKLVGISTVIDETTKKSKDLAIYIPINKKGALAHGMITTEMGIKDEESFIPYNNLIKQIPYAERIKLIKKEIADFKEIPFDKQQVTTKMVRTVAQEADADYANEMDALVAQSQEEDRQRRLANRKITAQDKQVIIANKGYRKGLPQANPDTDYVFTENAEVFTHTHNLISDKDETDFPYFPNVPKTNVQDIQGTNQAGIRTDSDGNISKNAYGIVVKKYQQNEKGYFVKEEGQFKDNDSDYNMFKQLNNIMFDELSTSENDTILFPASMALGKAALPLKFAEWLKTELQTRFDITYNIAKNNTPGYNGYGLSFNPEENPDVLGATVKEQFKKTPEDLEKGKEKKDICNPKT